MNPFIDPFLAFHPYLPYLLSHPYHRISALTGSSFKGSCQPSCFIIMDYQLAHPYSMAFLQLAFKLKQDLLLSINSD